MMYDMDAAETLAVLLAEAHDRFVENVEGVSLEEALDPAGGHRSVLGIIKHEAGWSAVRSFAFDPEPRHWDEAGWPRGLRDRIDPSRSYLEDVTTWFEETYARWLRSLRDAADVDAPHPVHWGDRLRLADIVVAVSQHWVYHAGEINALLAVHRGEAWEFTEEVEENHISTVGRRVRPPWMSDEEAARSERGDG